MVCRPRFPSRSTGCGCLPVSARDARLRTGAIEHVTGRLGLRSCVGRRLVSDSGAPMTLPGGGLRAVFHGHQLQVTSRHQRRIVSAAKIMLQFLSGWLATPPASPHRWKSSSATPLTASRTCAPTWSGSSSCSAAATASSSSARDRDLAPAEAATDGAGFLAGAQPVKPLRCRGRAVGGLTSRASGPGPRPCSLAMPRQSWL